MRTILGARGQPLEDGTRRLLGLFCHFAGGRWGPRIGGQSTKPGGGQRASLGPSVRIPARAAEGKGPQGPSATPEREREAGGGVRTGTGHPAPSPAAFQTGAADEVIPSGSLLATAAAARAGPDRETLQSLLSKVPRRESFLVEVFPGLPIPADSVLVPTMPD